MRRLPTGPKTRPKNSITMCSRTLACCIRPFPLLLGFGSRTLKKAGPSAGVRSHEDHRKQAKGCSQKGSSPNKGNHCHGSEQRGGYRHSTHRWLQLFPLLYQLPAGRRVKPSSRNLFLNEDNQVSQNIKWLKGVFQIL